MSSFSPASLILLTGNLVVLLSLAVGVGPACGGEDETPRPSAQNRLEITLPPSSPEQTGELRSVELCRMGAYRPSEMSTTFFDLAAEESCSGEFQASLRFYLNDEVRIGLYPVCETLNGRACFTPVEFELVGPEEELAFEGSEVVEGTLEIRELAHYDEAGSALPFELELTLLFDDGTTVAGSFTVPAAPSATRSNVEEEESLLDPVGMRDPDYQELAEEFEELWENRPKNYDVK